MVRRTSFLLIFSFVLSLAPLVAQQHASSLAKLTGAWDAVVIPRTKSGPGTLEVPFGLVIGADKDGQWAAITNGEERIEFSAATFDGSTLTLRLDQYDGQIVATYDPAKRNELTGEYTRQTRSGIGHYGFRARRVAFGHEIIEEPVKVEHAWSAPSLNGDWTMTFLDEGGTDRVAPAHFRQEAAHLSPDGKSLIADVTGTIAPVSGDYGLMGGTISVPLVNGKPDPSATPRAALSRFDGIHAVVMTAEITPAGLNGKLAFSSTTAMPFTGVKAESTPARAATLEKGTDANAVPDPESITKVKDPAEPFHFSGLDPRTGKTLTQDDFKGKPVIIDIFGTWCPNCHDEAPVLVDLYNKYRQHGLEVVALAYEYTDDPARNARVIEVYRKKYGIPFTLLVSGTTDQGQIQKTLPQLEGFGAYPTTIFVGRDGRVKKIHAGFAGPATGQLPEVKRRFEQNVEELLK